MINLTLEDINGRLLIDGFDVERIAEFGARHKAQPSIWRHFERLALEAARDGRRVGQNCIRELVRWECSKEKSGGDFELNNNDTPIYARIFEWKYPEFTGFFELRECRRRAA